MRIFICKSYCFSKAHCVTFQMDLLAWNEIETTCIFYSFLNQLWQKYFKKSLMWPLKVSMSVASHHGWVKASTLFKVDWLVVLYFIFGMNVTEIISWCALLKREKSRFLIPIGHRNMGIHIYLYGYFLIGGLKRDTLKDQYRLWKHAVCVNYRPIQVEQR